MYDMIIIGAGPAGMSAALYGMRAGFSVLMFEHLVSGGQIVTTPEVENYPGFGRIAGWELAEKMSSQLSERGITPISEEVTAIEQLSDGAKRVTTSGGSYETKTVIIANGAKRRKIGCDGEERFAGRGVSYCAVCDGGFFRGKTTAVVGGGNSAIEDALYLSEVCEKVYIIQRRGVFRAAKGYMDAAKLKANIEFLPPAKIKSINGANKVDSITLIHSDEDTEYSISVDGVFVSIGLVPDNARFAPPLALDEGGYIIAGEDCKTNIDGVFAAGDTRTKALRQIVTAVADGAAAATYASEFIHAAE